MRTGKVLCVVLFTVGACCAFPQYGPPKQEEEEQQQAAAVVPVVPVAPVEPVAPVVPEAPLGGALTDQQKEALGEFWWQNQGVFTGEGNGGTVVVVQEQSSVPAGQILDEVASSPFIPSPSPDCAELHGCIPWQFCVDGVFTNTGEGLLALRTPSKVPDTYTQKLCGQIGNVCCRIPDAILAAQQEGQSGGAGPYGSGDIPGGEIIDVVSPGGEIIEVVNTGDGAAPVAVVDVVAGPEGAYDALVDGAGPGPIVEQVSGGAVPVIEQVSGGVGPDVEQVSGGAGGYGGGVREDIDQQPGGSVGIVEISDSGCPAYTHDCVPYFQCIDGEINTSGAGLIDVRIKPQKECTNPEYPEVPGICCKIPGATPIPADPTPEPVQDCPGTAVCVLESQCNYDGTVNTDGAGLIDTRLRTTCYVDYVDAANYQTGVCCQPPAPVSPAPLVTCPGTQVCVSTGQCASQAAGGATFDASAITSCYYSEDQAVLGECCDPPTVPETPEPLVTCPGTQECVEQYQCTSDGTINTDGAGLINTRVYHKPCYLDAAYSKTGVCCQPPAPIAPEPLVTCPGDQICLGEAQCTSQGAATSGSGSGYDSCVLDGATSATGVCCENPVRLVDICPGDSVCIPEILCQGEILTHDDQYKPYGSSGDWSWSQCSISGDVNTPGVCCRNPEPADPIQTVDPDAPLNAYVVADRCGERNYGLNLRTPTKLKKNEAVFGEFPWQAVIFFTNYTFKCGASLVEDKWLITAAHCVDGYQHGDFKVRLGEWQVDKYDEPLKYVDVDIASITIHPDFKPGPVHNDIALIELTAPVTFQYHINTVCLPNAGQKPAAGTRCFASGWGKDAFNGNYQAILKKVDVPYVEHAYCQDLLRKTRLGKYFILDKSFMCAGGEENIDACEGDGGGPLVCKDPEAGTYYLAGITAWGIDCGQKDIPGVYADVQLFRPWIDGIIHGDEQQVSAGAYGRK